MAYSTIDKPSKYFTAKLYTGTGSAQSITGLEFSPDFVWIKDRTSANNHRLLDIIRGSTKELYSSTDDSETTQAQSLTAFNSDGFSIGNLAQINTSSNNYVSWCWDANGAGVSNTSGTISSTVSANTTSGFSIVSYTGNATLSQTIGHGLGVAPRMIIFKTRSGLSDWGVYHESMTNTKRILLNLTNASGNFTWGGSPTSSVFYVNNDGLVNGSGSTYIAYCFAEVKGYSKFSSYTGNGNADGTFIYTGFKPAFVLLKSSSSVENWHIFDDARNTFNPADKDLRPNLANAETTSSVSNIDFLSNGFKLRNSDADYNSSGTTYIGFAVAEQPFVSSKGIVANAR